MLRKRLLVVGCGNVVRRALAQWLTRYDVSVLLRAPDEAMSARGVRLYVGDLDRPETLAPLAGAADLVVHSAPPPEAGPQDTRTRAFLATLAYSQNGGGMLPRRLVYISTSGVYGDCGGAWVSETRNATPRTPRAWRRVDAERQLRRWGRSGGPVVSILRAPGIYAAERLPVERIRRGESRRSRPDDGDAFARRPRRPPRRARRRSRRTVSGARSTRAKPSIAAYSPFDR